MIFVNQDKFKRAQDIVALFGNKPPKTEEETRVRARFADLLATNGIKPESKDALQFVYEKLGGLVRTEEEQKEVEEQKEEIKKGRGRPKK